MIKNSKKVKSQEATLYNNILLLSRNELFYTKFDLSDTFQNRIHLIFIHISFIFIKTKIDMKDNEYKTFYQKLFDLLFKQIELNMREVGYGDVSVNKYMKALIKSFYNILLYCENYKNEKQESKNIFFSRYLKTNIVEKMANNEPLIKYFDKFQAFCFDLSADKVLKGKLNFKNN